MIKRPSLGEAASLGTLYDARADSFIPVSLLRGQPPPGAIATTDNPSTDVKMSCLDTYREKFNSLNVGADLKASFLAGLVRVGGSGGCLLEKREANHVRQESLLVKITTVNEVLNFAADGLGARLDFDSLKDNHLATHVVTGIDWGAFNVVTAKRSVSKGDSSKQIEGDLHAQLELLNVQRRPKGAKSGESHDFDETSEVTIYADVRARDGIMPTNFKSANEFLSNVSKYIDASNDGKGKPLSYTMLPLSYVARKFNIDIARDITVNNLSEGCSESFVQLFDELSSTQQNLIDYENFVKVNRQYIPPEHVNTVHSLVLKGRAVEADFKSQYARSLIAVRSGEKDVQELLDLLRFCRNRGSDQISIDTKYIEKVQFVQSLVDRGAIYIGFNGQSLDQELATDPRIDKYVLSFSEDARHDSPEWGPTFSILHELLDDEDHTSRVLLKDCDALDKGLTTPKISLLRNTQVVVDDVLQERKLMGGNCIIRYNEACLDDIRREYKPVQRVPVRIPCPGRDCRSGQKHDWVCFKCGSIVWYGQAEKYLYCECGRCELQNWDFKCTSPRHGLDFKKENPVRLSKLLDSLEPFEELNILILGPTGVGKSTWINAFANYLIYNSLDDALNADKLRWMIPFSFRTYRANEGEEYEPITVKVGVSDDEHDGSTGTSATQRTLIHRVTYENRLVRLIDTPGIGDTRGPSKDQENMADLLNTLRTYEKLHGILILLKPNDQRLNLTFRFCIQELLTHLHRDAAQNIAFGFTNTRGTNYMPGDSFDPLRKLLSNYADKEVKIGLYKHNVYCFDSESFRYLAAFKEHNEKLGDKVENAASWKYSTSESRRLVDYFTKLDPHQVTSTVNLNETRYQILILAKPMAENAEKIKSSISVIEDEIKELDCSKMKRKDLKAKLITEVNVVYTERIDKPRTTCSHADCIEHSRVDGVEGADGNPILTTVYKTTCHSPCYLEDITVDRIGHPGLESCAAMDGDRCKVCGHNWASHMHVKYNVRPGKKKISDPDVEEALKRNASDTELKEKGIESKKEARKKLESVYNEIRNAAAQFSIYLKMNSIIPYNDVTLAYVDDHIDEEKKKINVGGSKDKLKRLKEFRSQYAQNIKVLEENMGKSGNRKPPSQREIQERLEHLYSLEWYGEILEGTKEMLLEAPQMGRREKSRIVIVPKENARGKDLAPTARSWLDTARSFGSLLTWTPFGPTKNTN